MNVTSSSIRGFKNIEVHYRLISTSGNPKGLAIFFPGMGYTVMGPLLHYPTGMFLNEEWDVLQINYQYDSAEIKEMTDEEFDEMMVCDCKNVIDAVLESAAYESFFLVAKSVGTIPMSAELQRTSFKGARIIWLTPLLKEKAVHETMMKSRQKAISFIGDRDHHYHEERFNELNTNPNLQLHLIPGANHSLEQDFRALESIDIHKKIMEDIEAFIKEA
ncbi:alpha/beta family hydrolase [Bacillus sp. Marseille-Q1617]|uniref:alpha/beta family hydrolase n=1 Tax=Bacillus sp. Marseille-Q1617 TaxID=2736887 RepID=UPI00158CB641|nr:alpha/beta family hydrolase [Bacillus sp. Marseille-Q1617]